MKQTIQSISKGEVKFWFGIIAIIVSMLGGLWSVKSDLKIEIALLGQKVDTLSTRTEEVNNKYSSGQEADVIQFTDIAIIKTILKIK